MPEKGSTHVDYIFKGTYNKENRLQKNGWNCIQRWERTGHGGWKVSEINEISEKSVKSMKSQKSKRNKKKEKEQCMKSTQQRVKLIKQSVGKTQDDDLDSRTGDFDDIDTVSLGSDASKVDKINQEMEKLAPTWTEKYNEYKCQQGYQQRLEDAELRTELHRDEVYQEAITLHREQLVATTESETRAKRRLELSKLENKLLKREKQQNWLNQKLISKQ